MNRFEQFSYVISGINRHIQKIERDEMIKYGYKGAFAQYLVALRRYPEGITSAKLCGVCEKDKAAISRSVSELEQAGLLQRTERNGIRYRALLVLTEQGIAAAEAVSRRARQAVEQAGEGLTDAQREVFYGVLAQIAGNLHNICKDGLK